MNCQELHNYFETDPRLNADYPPAIADHAAGCVSCARFLDERNALTKNLGLVRQSVAEVPESLDARVLSDFRRHASEPKPATLFFSRRPILAMRGWSAVAAMAAALVIAAVLFATMRKPEKANIQTPAQPSTATAANSTATPVTSPQVAKTASPVKPKRRPASRPSSSEAAVASSRFDNRLPAGFRSLMYCDELTCSAPMQMIRVQIPSGMIARPTPSLVNTSGAVNADVLIGSDGIARGIRIVDF